MEKARCNTELYTNLRAPLNNVKPSNFLGSHQGYLLDTLFYLIAKGNAEIMAKGSVTLRSTSAVAERP